MSASLRVHKLLEIGLCFVGIFIVTLWLSELDNVVLKFQGISLSLLLHPFSECLNCFCAKHLNCFGHLLPVQILFILGSMVGSCFILHGVCTLHDSEADASKLASQLMSELSFHSLLADNAIKLHILLHSIPIAVSNRAAQVVILKVFACSEFVCGLTTIIMKAARCGLRFTHTILYFGAFGKLLLGPVHFGGV